MGAAGSAASMTGDGRGPETPAKPQQGAPAEPAALRFLHTVDLLDGRALEGDLDWRGSEEALLGAERLWGLRVVEVAPGSAWLSAHVATRCTEYSVLDRPAAVLADGKPDGVREGWRHVMQALGLQPGRVEDAGLAGRQPGGYDAALLFGALSRAANPLELLETSAALSGDMMIVIEPTEMDEFGTRNEPRATMLPDSTDPYGARWVLSQGLIERLLARAGFDRQVVTRHVASAEARQAGYVTVVARRSSPPVQSGRAAIKAGPPASPRQAPVEELSPDLEAAMDLPLPSPGDRLAAVGTADVEVFVAVGRAGFSRLVQALGRNGVAPQQLGRVLDLGCGVSRILRWWRMFPRVELHGTDIDVAAITWNRERLGYGVFGFNTLDPKLDYPPNVFDLVYAVDVMTHLPEHLQLGWFKEAFRVLKPGGHLHFTTRGRSCRALLPPSLQAIFDANRLVSGGAEQAGTNDCVAFHPPGWVVDNVLPAAGATLVELIEHPVEAPGEDCWLIRKPV